MRNSKRIIVIHLGRKGAGPVYTLEMAKALYTQGYEVIYYASSTVENRQIVEKQSFEKRFFETYSTGIEYVSSVLTWYKIKRVVDSIKRDKPDIVYSCMNDLWAPFIFPKLKGIVRVKTIHDVGIHEGSNSRFNKWWNNTNFKDAEKFVILSQKFVPKLVERGIAQENILVIPHAGFDYYAGLSNSKSTKSAGRNILFFGRVDKYKGIEILLEAMPKVVEAYPDVKLCIAGNGNMDAYADGLANCKNNLDLQNRWIKDEEVAGFVSWADFVVLPYTHATQSGVIPLAYAFSKPVVVTNVGCLDEQVINGKTGYLVEGSNSEALADAMIEMLSDVAKMKAMGEYANKYMQEHLTWDASATKFIEFIH